MKIRIGTRGSRLALAQTDMVVKALKAVQANLDVEKVIIKTKGDKITDVSLDKIGDKGLFVKEIEEGLLSWDIDLAIHSMKDMPSDNPEGLCLEPVLSREDPRDVLVTKHLISSLSQLPEKPIIATGSRRRACQLEILLPDVQIVPIRGNVETRIRKMVESECDGTVLAAAGLTRLGLTGDERYSLVTIDVDQMIPAPAQGIIAAQFRSGDERIAGLVKRIQEKETVTQALVERRFLQEVNGSCHLPMGAYLELGHEATVYAIYGDEEGKKIVSAKRSGTIEEAESIVVSIAKELLKEVKA